MQPVQSSTIKAIGYDPASKTLSVEFHKTGVYDFPGVAPETHAALMSAPSPGSHFSARVKPHHTGKRRSK